MNLKEIILSGNDKILNNESNHPHAQVYMAYHAGISKGQSFTSKIWERKANDMQNKAKESRYHNLISKHIPMHESGDGDKHGSEASEILLFQY